MERWDERDHDADGWVTAAPMNVIDIRTGEQFVRLVPRPRVVKPAPDEPADWMVVDCRVPGVPRGPYTLKRALEAAREFRGLVRPWAAGEPKAKGDYPSPGQMQRER